MFAIVPWYLIFDNYRFYFIKVTRIIMLFSSFDPKIITFKLNEYNLKKLERAAIDYPFDMLNDHININRSIMIRYSIFSLRVMIQIIISGYFTGILIFILFEVTNSDFFEAFELEELSTFDLTVLFWYFSFTTVTTVGLGDYYPVSNYDRIFFSAYILMAVLIFSVVLNNLQESL